jgi:hypothetical protein
MPSFDRSDLDLLRERREVRIETSAGPEAPVHSAVIWVVVDERDRVLVRSWLGSRGRWYLELLSNPDGILVAGDRRIPVRAERATDAGRIEACSRGLELKYRRSASLRSMLVDEILDTTMELHPR